MPREYDNRKVKKRGPQGPTGKRKSSMWPYLSPERLRHLRQLIIEGLAREEAGHPPRKEWMERYTSFHKPPFNDLTGPQNAVERGHFSFSDLLWRFFTAEELNEMEATAAEQRFGAWGGYCVNLLERLYQQGMDGDTVAAKEFLNRILGKPSQQIFFRHEAGDSLTQLLEQFRPEGAYQTPKLDSQGREIISIESGESDDIPEADFAELPAEDSEDTEDTE